MTVKNQLLYTHHQELKTYATVFIGIALMEAYAINLAMHGAGLMFLVTNSMALTINGVLCGVIISGRQDRGG